MGKIGRKLFGVLGKGIGNFAGQKLGKFTGMDAGAGSKIGEDIGNDIGDLLPFKKGGRIKKNMIIRAHKGEFILPKGVPPTKSQIKKVRKRGGRL